MISKLNFKEELAKVNITLTDQMVNQFDLYFKLIDKYNKVMDLTAVNGEDEVYERHFYNSLSIAFNDDFNNLHLCDVGAGAGFPSIPLKIAFPDMKLTIIDPLNKRMEFLKVVIKELDLKDVNIVVARAEDVSKTNKEKFDIVTARAVARLNILVEVVSQLIKVDGMFKNCASSSIVFVFGVSIIFDSTNPYFAPSTSASGRLETAWFEFAE